MKLRRNKDKAPELNTTSMADISFMLLVFFLVTTSMYVDKALSRSLPPKDNKETEAEELQLDRENILALTLDAAGQVRANDTLVQENNLKNVMLAFILSRGDKHVLTISADPSCPYDAYFHLQNHLSEAYNEARAVTARETFGKEMSQLNESQRTTVLTRVPRRVAENFKQEEEQR